MTRKAAAAKVHPMVAQLRAERIRQNIPQYELAGRMGYTMWQVGLWERGRNTPNLGAFVNWANALGMELQLVPKGNGT